MPGSSICIVPPRKSPQGNSDSWLFLHSSGDEDDGYDETLIPVDFKSAGQIVDGRCSRIYVIEGGLVVR
jgi:hypothetical protein